MLILPIHIQIGDCYPADTRLINALGRKRKHNIVSAAKSKTHQTCDAFYLILTVIL